MCLSHSENLGGFRAVLSAVIDAGYVWLLKLKFKLKLIKIKSTIQFPVTSAIFQGLSTCMWLPYWTVQI